MSNRISQLPVEILVLSNTPILARLSQLPVEVLVLPVGAASARLSQLPIEILILESVPVTEKTQFFFIVA